MLSALFRVAHNRMNRKKEKLKWKKGKKLKKKNLTNKQEINELLYNNVMIKL